jgi:predicted secreted acid phosphatase
MQIRDTEAMTARVRGAECKRRLKRADAAGQKPPAGAPSIPRLLTNIVFLTMIAGCAAKPIPASSPTQVAAAEASVTQPENVGDAKIRATQYHDSGEYERDLKSVGAQAVTWMTERASKVAKPALVLDIDETALSNWTVIQADDFGRIIPGPCDSLPDGPCGWQSWDLLGRDPAIDPTLQAFRRAQAMHVAVFFITGRPESQRKATERNLHTAGYDGYVKMYMVPDGAHFASAADYKAPIRKAIEESGYTIIANMGDQPSDLAGGHAEKDFLLPDPFYRIP